MRKIIAVLFLVFCLTGAEAQEDTLREPQQHRFKHPSGRPSVALVLGGGGAKGFAHIAVLELIEELGIPIDLIAGVSAGAIVGGLYSAGYSPAMILEAMEGRDWTAFFQDGEVSPFWNSSEELPLAIRLDNSAKTLRNPWGKGYSSGQRVYGFFKSLTAKVPSYIDFDTLHIPFRAGAVEIPGGKFELIANGDLAEAIRASMSIQGIFEPFIIDGKSYVDGGITNILPVKEVREMGYDIVIAVDLFVPPDQFEMSDLPNLMNTLYTNYMSREHQELADVVLFPLPHGISIMNFAGGKDIYAKAREKNDSLSALLEPIRKRIASYSVSPAEHSGVYRDLSSLTVEKLILDGALRRDRRYIEKTFSRLIRGKPLSEKNITAFLEKIYETGNYRIATVRTLTEFSVAGENETCLELILHSETENKIFFRAGLDYEGTFSETSTNRTAIRGGFEYRWKDGSSLFLKSSVFNEVSVGLSYFRPMGPYFFISAETDLIRDQELRVKGFLDEEGTAPDRLFYFRGALKAGIRFNSHNSLSFWPEYFWFNDEDSFYSMTSAAAAYTFYNLDYPIFPSGGFYARIENQVRFSLGADMYDVRPCDLVSADLAAAIPLGKFFSMGAGVFGSFLIGSPDLPPWISNFKLDKVRRIYFPHTPDIFAGEKRAAFSLTIQFEPMENLSLLGGRMIFSLTGAAGRSASSGWEEWADFKKENILWNVSLGAALVLTENIGFQLRAGAGGGDGQNAVPFLSLDVGMSRFRKRLF